MPAFRDLINDIAPPWLKESVGERVLYPFGLARDLLAEKTRQGVRARMPGFGTPTALPYSGADRRIIRGFQETDDAYALRLRRFLDSWAHAGSPTADLTQLAGFVSPTILTMREVGDSGVWDTCDDGATVWHWFRQDGVHPADNWDWDSLNGYPTTRWWRTWFIIYAGSLWAKDGTWGSGGKWGDGGAWGSTMTKAQALTIRAIIAQWKGQHSSCQWIILAFDDTWFSPFAAAGSAKLPDGQWGKWSRVVGGVYVKSRTETARYADGVT
jgi:hypothetical protein